MNKILIALLLIFGCSTLGYSAANDEKPTVYIYKSRKITNKDSLAKYNYINVDKDPEMFIGKKPLKNLSAYLKEDVDITQINTDSLSGNVFVASFVIGQRGEIRDICIEAGITPEINKQMIERIEKIECIPGEKDKQVVPVAQNASISFSDIKRPDSIPLLKGGQWMPEFVGGQEVLMMYISQNIKYPRIDKNRRKEGRVIARFVVSKTGKIKDIKIMKSLGFEYDREVIRVIREMPDWTPGYKDGEPASVFFTLPVMFRVP